MDRLSFDSSVRSSLPSLMGDGEEGGGEDAWTQGMTCGLLMSDLKEEEIDWKKRYEELEIIMMKYQVENARAKDLFQKKVSDVSNFIQVLGLIGVSVDFL
ncbi:uncharacterized protein TNIN_298561 [Trichonephila inaurata madagascariensis]|uniref:Uncharacterized protein n=1 Tax=Trichonephila inaurata madagascariensis TaxID=2747483 RepID=A0A8X7CJU7_9ARAC|nr:uncharacterized protein TNIN_298561 [Trichonephila inaurata madagascariensis]